MKLYKYTPSLEIAKKISGGIFRFYELTKYVKIEDEAGRADPEECSVGFLQEEYEKYPEKLPIASFRGVEFNCISIRPDEKYIKQFFVFCMSTNKNVKAIGDSRFAVELYKDYFDLFMQLLNEPFERIENPDGRRFFSHAKVEYYDVHSHPKPIVDTMWREAYLKHTRFEYQNEYRAVFFVSDSFFNRIMINPLVIERKIFTMDKKPMDFGLQLYLQSGIDDEGWRFLEIDISKFAANMSTEPNKIIELFADPS